MKYVRMTMPVLTLALLLGASACGSTSAGSSTGSSSGTPSRSAGQGQQGAGRQGGQPGANGTIVDVSGSTMQVQSDQSGQVAVTWDGKTTFTRQAAGKLADVKIGDCVMVTSDGAGSGSSSPSSSPVAASSVRVTAATKGSCSIGGGQGRPGGFASGRPSGAPSGGPSGAPRGGFGGGVFGTVKAVTGGGFSVTSVGFGKNSASSTVDVSTSSRTTVSRTVTATSKAVRTGLCVTARGASDDTGAITATTVSLTRPVDGSCGFGFGRRGGSGGASGSTES